MFLRDAEFPQRAIKTPFKTSFGLKWKMLPIFSNNTPPLFLKLLLPQYNNVTFLQHKNVRVIKVKYHLWEGGGRYGGRSNYPDDEGTGKI